MASAALQDVVDVLADSPSSWHLSDIAEVTGQAIEALKQALRVALAAGLVVSTAGAGYYRWVG